MIKKLGFVVASMLLVFAVTSCSSSDDSSSGVASTSDYDIYVPENVEIYNDVEGDFDGVMVYAGEDAAEEIDSSKADTTTIKLGDRDLTGIIVQTLIPSGCTDETTSLTYLISSLQGTQINTGTSTDSSSKDDDYQSFYISGFTSVGLQTFAQDNSVLGSYIVSVGSSVTPTGLINGIAKEIGMNSTSTKAEVSDLMDEVDDDYVDDIETTAYRLYIGVKYSDVATDDYPDGSIAVLIALVPEARVDYYKSVARDISSTNNIVDRDADLSDKSDSFTTQAGSGLADFLFVVDNSGSMAADQSALSTAATDFVSSISNSGLDYKMATITTDQFSSFTDSSSMSDFTGDYFRDSNSDGYITSSLTEFQSDLVAGTGGSATETGIWNAEHCLYSTASGNSYDGFVTTAGMPRSGASMSVVILSDEKSQYTSATLNTSNTTFDASNNLFIDRNYYVHSIIATSYNSSSQYDDLANQSGGLVADISASGSFDVVMDNIATQAGGASSAYLLTYTAIPSSISVTVDGSSVAKGATNGWTYVQGNNSISFHGTAIPTEGASVAVSYQSITSSSKSDALHVITAVDALAE